MSSLKSNIKEFGKKYLHDFSIAPPWAFERQLPGLCQGIGFCNGHGSLKGRFTIDVFLRYDVSPRDYPGVMDCWFRIGWFIDGSDGGGWFLIDDPQSYERVGRVLEIGVKPFFKEHSSIEAVIRSYEEGKFPKERLFGISEDWLHFNLGYCYLWIRNNAKAAEHLSIVLEKYSDEPYDFVQKRKQWTLEGLAKANQQ